MAAEYVLAEGNPNVVLCERGIRTFERATRHTLDLNAVVMVRERTHLPVIVDPSHAAGVRSLVGPLSLGALAAGACGLIVEVHPDPGRCHERRRAESRPADVRGAGERVHTREGRKAGGGRRKIDSGLKADTDVNREAGKSRPPLPAVHRHSRLPLTGPSSPLRPTNNR